MRSCPRGPRRSVDRGAHRPAIEPRKFPILGADTVQMVEGNTSGCDSASARTTRRGQRPWHVHTLLAREPGDLAIDRCSSPLSATFARAMLNAGSQGPDIDQVAVTNRDFMGACLINHSTCHRMSLEVSA